MNRLSLECNSCVSRMSQAEGRKRGDSPLIDLLGFRAAGIVANWGHKTLPLAIVGTVKFTASPAALPVPWCRFGRFSRKTMLL